MNSWCEGQLAKAVSSKNVHPYLLLLRGPVPTPCPVHGKNENVVLPVDHPYWRDKPLRDHPDCKCWFLGVSRRRFERLKNEGVQDPDAPPILSNKGFLTGHREKRMIPIKTRLVE